jgi:membrane protein
MRTAFHVLKDTWSGFSNDNGTSFAAAIAYYTLLSIFPFALFAVGLAGYFISGSQRQQLTDKIVSFMGSGGGQLSSNIQQQVSSATHGSAALTIFGIITAAWSASAVFSAIRTGLWVIWNNRQKKNFIVQKVLDLGGVVGLGVVLGLGLASNIALAWVSSLVTHLFGGAASGVIGLLFGIIFFLAPIAIAFLAFELLYTLASDPEIGWKQVWPGAIFCAVGFQVLSVGFSIYLRFFGHYAKVYGTLGAVIAFLFYAYLIGILILLGAELADQLIRHGIPRSEYREQRRAAAAKGDAIYVAAPADGRKGEEVTAGELFPEPNPHPQPPGAGRSVHGVRQ